MPTLLVLGTLAGTNVERQLLFPVNDN